MSEFFTAQQLAAKVGRCVRTIREHTRNGWLKAEPKRPGVRGSRYSQRNATKWASLHFPGVNLS